MIFLKEILLWLVYDKEVRPWNTKGFIRWYQKVIFEKIVSYKVLPRQSRIMWYCFLVIFKFILNLSLFIFCFRWSFPPISIYYVMMPVRLQWCRFLGRRYLRQTYVSLTCRGLSQPVRHRTESKVVRSPFSDVQIPENLIDEYVWSGLERWPDKDALVSGFRCDDSDWYREWRIQQ